mgnify:CR=1 FL=1
MHGCVDYLRAHGLVEVECSSSYVASYRTFQLGDKRSASSLESDSSDDSSEDDPLSPNSVSPLYISTPKVRSPPPSLHSPNLMVDGSGSSDA